VLHPVVSEPGTYTLTVMNTALGCEATDVVVVDASQDIPVPEISLSPISCFGDDNGAISVVSVSGGMEPYLFSLNGSPFSSTSTFQQLKPGVYELAVVDADGCENLLTIDIQEPQEVNVELIVYVEGGNIIHLGDSAQLEALLSLPFDSLDIIDWEPDSLLSCDGCPDPVAHPIQTTTFTVRVEKDGCSDSDKATIFVRKDRVLFVPNAFSPNNDGINDVFLVFAGPQVARVKSFLVFDRWGETVYQYYDFPPNDSAYGWDGTHRGKKFNPAVFTWFAEIEFVDGATEIFEGDVSLMR
jgi:gliding motility-associated-like protein